MASFAELKPSNNVVLRTVKIGDDVPTSDGPLGENDMHPDGETYCTNLFGGGIWKQCSATGAFRKQNAGIGDTYDAVKDKFIRPQPYPSWTLDSNDDWKAPVTYPSHTTIGSLQVYISWDEDNQKWLGETNVGDPIVITNYEWDASGLAWNEV